MSAPAQDSAQGSAPGSGSGAASPAERAWPLPWEPVEGDRDGFLARLEAIVVEGLVRLVTRLPYGLQRALVRGLARVARALDQRHADAARRFLEAALGPGLDPHRREALVLGAFEHFLTVTLETAAFERAVPPARRMEHFEIELPDAVREVLAAGTGALMLTAHLGAWEFCPLIATDLGFAPFYVVSRPPRNAPLSRSAQRVREARGFRLLHRHGAAASIPKVIAARGYVGLMVDQRARRKTILAPFFGRPAHCERAVAVFARRLGVPVVFGACFRTERRWRYRMVFTTVLRPDELAGLSLEAVTTRINAELERMIRLAPEQYFWLHDRYKGAPAPGSPAAPAS